MNVLTSVLTSHFFVSVLFPVSFGRHSVGDIGAEAALGLGDVLVPGLVLAWLAR